jgi:hypothetical protein
MSCSRRALVETELAVTRTFPLGRHLAAMTLPGFPALALLMASTTQGLDCCGTELLIVSTVTSLRTLLGTNVSEGIWEGGGAGFLAASA